MKLYVKMIKVATLVIIGNTVLRGNIKVSGAKNAALPILAASILADDESYIRNVPEIGDVDTQVKILQELGVRVERRGSNTIKIDPPSHLSTMVPNELSRKSRGSIIFMGALLAKTGYVQMGGLGGDAISPKRPIDFHLKGFEAMGGKVKIGKEFTTVEAEKLKGARIFLDRPSTTGTQNLMIAASLADGVTTIDNAEAVPEIVDLARFLTKMGAKVRGAGTSRIKIVGVKQLKGTNHNLIPDPFEAGTFMVATAATNGNVLIENAVSDHFTPTIAKLREAGVQVVDYPKGVRVIGERRKLRGINIYAAGPYPSFQSDMQQIFTTLMTLADGTSVITDSIFEKRHKQVLGLKKMGANITVKRNAVIVRGVKSLSGAVVSAHDIRGGAALVIAGLVADGETVVHNVQEIDRGYEGIDKKLNALGADIRRVNT